MPLHERYKGGFKEGDVVEEELLNDQSSAGNIKNLKNYRKIADNIKSNAEGNSYKYQISKQGFSSPQNHEILTKKVLFFWEKNKISKDNNNIINRDSNKFIDIKFNEEDLNHQGVHEVNEGTNKYVFTEPVTKADLTVLKLLNNGSKTTTTSY